MPESGREQPETNKVGSRKGAQARWRPNHAAAACIGRPAPRLNHQPRGMLCHTMPYYARGIMHDREQRRSVLTFLPDHSVSLCLCHASRVSRNEGRALLGWAACQRLIVWRIPLILRGPHYARRWPTEQTMPIHVAPLSPGLLRPRYSPTVKNQPSGVQRHSVRIASSYTPRFTVHLHAPSANRETRLVSRKRHKRGIPCESLSTHGILAPRQHLRTTIAYSSVHQPHCRWGHGAFLLCTQISKQQSSLPHAPCTALPREQKVLGPPNSVRHILGFPLTMLANFQRPRKNRYRIADLEGLYVAILVVVRTVSRPCYHPPDGQRIGSRRLPGGIFT